MTQIARADELKNQLQLGNSLPLILKAVPEATPTLTPTIMPSITATPTPTATFTPTPTPTLDVTVKPMGNVVITYIFFDGSGSDEPDEYVEIRNDDVGPILLHDWTLRDDADRIFTFPERVIFPAQVCRIYTNEYHPESCGFNYGSGSAIWNNSGDCAYLRDASSALVDDYCY